jgi:hypothetical protein
LTIPVTLISITFGEANNLIEDISMGAIIGSPQSGETDATVADALERQI